MGMMMGLTALFIFYSPWTAPSGAQINPAVTLTFWRLDKMCRYDAMFFIIFQFLGGTAAVYLMQGLMGSLLTGAPVNSAITVPGKAGTAWALVTEFLIAFSTMLMVLFTGNNKKLKKYTRIFAACLVCTWVIVAGPVSGFGMNPARTFASALPANTWTGFWIYLLMPVAGMLTAAETYLLVKKKNSRLRVVHRQYEAANNNQLRIMKQVLRSFRVSILILLSFTGVTQAQVTKVEAIGITVKDMNRSVRFYSEVLGFKKISDQEFNGASFEKLEGLFGINMRVVRMQLGEEFIDLTDHLTAGGRSIPEDQKSNDLFFQHIAIVVSDMDKAFEQLKRFNVEYVSTSPQTLPVSNVAAAGIKAFYFHDADNHNLELIYFPAGKGDPKWQKKNSNIFLGIDHTAIGVSSTENSRKFYQDILGIERKGDSWNFGTEQEHLNNVEGASLHITGFRAAAGPGVEFLQYLQPGPGKKYPSDTRADDIWFWQTTLITNDAALLFHKLRTSGYAFVSKELVHIHANGVHTVSFIVKDPDGHAVTVKEIKN